MSAYLIHSLPLKMSAIQIFVGDKMACASHLVGEDTIGGETDLQLDGEVRRPNFLNIKNHLNLNVYFHESPLPIFAMQFENSSWRAMLIKDNSGDWGVCTAAWKGLTPGVPGRPGIRF